MADLRIQDLTAGSPATDVVFAFEQPVGGLTQKGTVQQVIDLIPTAQDLPAGTISVTDLISFDNPVGGIPQSATIQSILDLAPTGGSASFWHTACPGIARCRRCGTHPRLCEATRRRFGHHRQAPRARAAERQRGHARHWRRPRPGMPHFG